MMSPSIRVQRAVTARETWVVVLVVLLCVAVPTALAMGFLWRAMDQERAARQAQEGELRRLRLLDAQSALDAWIERIATLHPLELRGLAPAASFAKAAASSLCDSVIVLREGQPSYPCRSLPLEDSAMTDEDRVGQELLRRGSSPRDCPPMAREASGRLVRPMLLLRAAKTDAATRQALQQMIADYETPVPMATAQRLFLAQELAWSWPQKPAEELALAWLAQSPPVPEPAVLSPVPGIAGLWQVLSPDRSLLVLLSEARVQMQLSAGAAELSAEDWQVRLARAEAAAPAGSVLHGPAGARLPGWELHLVSLRPALPGAASVLPRYLWLAAGIALGMALAAWLALRRFLAHSQATELRQDFLSTVSHELRTPLTSIRVLLDTLAAGQYADAQRTRQYVEVMNRETARLSHLVESFLTFTRLERGKLRFEMQEQPPAELAGRAVDVVEPRFEAEGVEFKFSADEDLPLVRADADTLVTALVNLLDNAFKYSRAPRCISLRVTRKSGGVAFEVQDNGQGFSAEEQRRLFERFYRAGSSQGTSGSGLGLSIVRFVMEAHGGHVSAHSEPGAGSTFTLHLPSL